MGRPVNKRYFRNTQPGQTFANDRIAIARYKRKGASALGTSTAVRIEDQLSETVFTLVVTASGETEVMKLSEDQITASTDTDDIGLFTIEAQTATGNFGRVAKLEQHEARIKFQDGTYEKISWPKTRSEAGISTITAWALTSSNLTVTVEPPFFYKVGDTVRLSGTGNSQLDGFAGDISSLHNTDANTFIATDFTGTADSGTSGNVARQGTSHINLRA